MWRKKGGSRLQSNVFDILNQKNPDLLLGSVSDQGLSCIGAIDRANRSLKCRSTSASVRDGRESTSASAIFARIASSP